MNGPLIAVTVGLLLANAFFVGAEFAVISARRSSIEPLATPLPRAARPVLIAISRRFAARRASAGMGHDLRRGKGRHHPIDEKPQRAFLHRHIQPHRRVVDERVNAKRLILT